MVRLAHVNFFNRSVQGTSYGERASDNKTFAMNREMCGAATAGVFSAESKIRFENKSGRTTKRTTLLSPATARPRRYSCVRRCNNRFETGFRSLFAPVNPRYTCPASNVRRYSTVGLILRICFYVIPERGGTGVDKIYQMIW